MLCAASTALLIAPAAFRRVIYRRRLKQHLVRVANRLALSGLVLLLLSMASAVLLIMDVVLGLRPPSCWPPGCSRGSRCGGSCCRCGPAPGNSPKTTTTNRTVTGHPRSAKTALRPGDPVMPSELYLVTMRASGHGISAGAGNSGPSPGSSCSRCRRPRWACAGPLLLTAGGRARLRAHPGADRLPAADGCASHAG